MTIRKNIYGISGPLKTECRGPNTKCAYFDGSSYIYFPNDIGYTFGNSKFTIDFWINHAPDGTGFSEEHVIDRQDGSTNQWTVARIRQLPTLPESILGAWGNPPDQTNRAIKLPFTADNEWHHIALVREGNTGTNDTLTMYLDGKEGANDLCSQPWNGTGNLYIGRQAFSLAYLLNGYLNNIRITKNEALWINDFNPPDLHSFYETTSNTSLYCPFYLDLNDHSDSKLSATNVGVTLVDI